jgi:hypothetical protein
MPSEEQTTSVGARDAWKALERRAIAGARTVDRLTSEDYEDAVNDALLAVSQKQPKNPGAYVWKAARDFALKRATDLRREERFHDASVPFASGKRQRKPQPLRLKPDELSTLGRVRSQLVRDVKTLIDERGRFRTATVHAATLGFVHRRIQEAFPDRIRGVSRRAHAGGRPKKRLHDPANAKLVNRILLKRRIEAQAERFVDRQLRRYGFNARETNATKREEAFDRARLMRKWKRRMEAAIEEDRRAERRNRG